MKAELLKAHLKAHCLGRKRTVPGSMLEHTLHLNGPFGAPTRAQRSGPRGERRSDGAGELFAVRRKRASAVRDDENRLRRQGVPIASSREGYFYAANAGEIYTTIRQLRQMEKGLHAAIVGLEGALEKFGAPAEAQRSGFDEDGDASE